MSIVFTEDHGAARHIVLNRPEKRNAMNQELLHALREALREAAAEESVHCVVLRGEGPVFSAGVDLEELGRSASRTGMLRPFREVFLDCANACEEMTKPVICQIHRACLGGALEVALGCDLRVASSDSQLGLPEVRFGLIPDVGGSTRLPAVVGLGRAKEMIMTARAIDAAEAHAIGLVNRVVEPGELVSATGELVEELLANSHIAVGRAKRVLDASARPALAGTLEMEVAVQEFCIASARAAMNGARPDVPATQPSPAADTQAPAAADTRAPAAAEAQPSPGARAALEQPLTPRQDSQAPAGEVPGAPSPPSEQPAYEPPAQSQADGQPAGERPLEYRRFVTR
jgi:enoyl-CoA hydratase/carnithine racemase